jgi:cell division GTPase FtsZ
MGEENLSGCPRVNFVGVGGGGCALLQSIYDQRKTLPACVEFVAVDANIRVLDGCRERSNGRIQTFCFGQKYFRGFDTNGDVEKVCATAEESGEILSGIFPSGGWVLLIATLGGGVGSGLAPVLAKLASRQGASVVSIVTQPFEFEGQGRYRRAENGLQSLQVISDLVLPVPDNLLFQVLSPEATVKEAFRESARWINALVDGIVGPLLRPSTDGRGLLHLVLDKPDVVFFAWGFAENGDLSEAVDSLLSSPFWKTLENSSAICHLQAVVSTKESPPIQVVKMLSHRLRERFRNPNLEMVTIHVPLEVGNPSVFTLALGHVRNSRTYRYPSSGKDTSAGSSETWEEQGHFRFATDEEDDRFDPPTYLRKGIKIDL